MAPHWISFGRCSQRERAQLVVVDLLAVLAHAVRDDLVELAREVDRAAVREVAAVVEVHGEDGVARTRARRGRPPRWPASPSAAARWRGRRRTAAWRARSRAFSTSSTHVAAAVVAPAGIALGVLVGAAPSRAPRARPRRRSSPTRSARCRSPGGAPRAQQSAMLGIGLGERAASRSRVEAVDRSSRRAARGGRPRTASRARPRRSSRRVSGSSAVAGQRQHVRVVVLARERRRSRRRAPAPRARAGSGSRCTMTPRPVPQITMPRGASPLETARAAGAAKSG